MTPYTLQGAWRFLSTPSARRATSSRKKWMSRRLYFYPRPPRGGRPKGGYCTAVAQLISIHALREEGDGGSTPNPATVNEFLSTPSARRATQTGLHNSL